MARLANVFNKEEVQKKEEHPRRNIKWVHYSKLKDNEEQYCGARDKEEIEYLADLIEAAGEVLEDLTVSKVDTDEYKIIAGHKRREACKLLAEERGLKQFEFLPCVVNNVSATQESFRVIASNGHHVKTAYEVMHEIKKVETLLREHPEDFPVSLQKGRMVERLAKQFGISRSTIGEYQLIAKNLTPEAMEKFKTGEIEKSAAVALSRMPQESQKDAVERGIIKNVDIEEYRKSELEPDAIGIRVSYRLFGIDDYDRSTVSRKALAHFLRGKFGRTAYQTTQGTIDISCDVKGTSISDKKVTWERYIKLLDQYCPRTEEKNEPAMNFSTKNEQEKPEDRMKTVGSVKPEKREKAKHAFIPMDEIIEGDAPEEEQGIPEEELDTPEGIAGKESRISRWKWLGGLEVRAVADYLCRNLAPETLMSTALLYQWLSADVDSYGEHLN